jgi:hypothetical protein
MASQDSAFDRNDRGLGTLKPYRGVLMPTTRRVRIRLAGSNPYQDELRSILESGTAPLETAISRRSQQEEAVDAPIVVRLFTGSRVSGPVGSIPRGVESAIDEALSRLDRQGRKPRIPVEIIRKRGLYRVEVLIGETR